MSDAAQDARDFWSRFNVAARRGDVIMAVGAEMEAFALEGAKADDQAVAAVYQKAGGKAYDMNDATVKRWQAIARDTAWKDFAGKNESCARILKLAEATL